MDEEVYLGDSVYVSIVDGYLLKLVADRSKVIYLEPSVYAALVRFAASHGLTINPED